MNQVTKFLKEVKEEMDKVVWPTRDASVRYTIVVLVISIVIGLYLTMLDSIFVRLMNRFILS